PSAAAERPAVVDDGVADLAGAGAVALEERAAKDQAGTDAAPDADRDQVRDAALTGVRVLGEGGCLGVVRDVDGHAVPVADDRAQRQVPPVEVDRTADRAGPTVDETGRPDPDAEERGRDPLEEAIEEVEDEVHRVVAVTAGDRQLDGSTDLAAEVDERPRELLLAEIQPDDEPRVLIDLEEDRRLAATRRTTANLAHHAFVEEAGDDVRDGGPGQAGLASDVGAADRAEVVDSPHDEALVVDAGLLVRRLGGKRHDRAEPLLVAPGGRPSADFVQSLDKDGSSRRTLSRRWTKFGWGGF